MKKHTFKFEISFIKVMFPRITDVYFF